MGITVVTTKLYKPSLRMILGTVIYLYCYLLLRNLQGLHVNT